MKVKDIVLVHGLNNSKQSFYPLKRALTKLGFKVHLLYLAGHRSANKDLSLEDSLTYLEKQLDKIKSKHFHCIGFSQGGLALQLLPPTVQKRIKKQVLLAPALSLKASSILSTFTSMMPAQMPFLSLAPKKLSKFSWLSVAYFDLLFQQIKEFDLKKPSTIKTLIMVDPKDELINVDGLKEIVSKRSKWKLEMIERPGQTFICLGQGHIVFHPQYFKKTEWKDLLEKIKNFLN